MLSPLPSGDQGLGTETASQQGCHTIMLAHVAYTTQGWGIRGYEVPSSGWWCFPSSDVFAFCQLWFLSCTCRIYVQTPFWSVVSPLGITRLQGANPVSFLGAVYPGCCPEAALFCSSLGTWVWWTVFDLISILWWMMWTSPLLTWDS